MSYLMPIDRYFSELQSAVRGHETYFVLDRELRLRNCLALARDIGFGLRDYPIAERHDFLQKAYGAIFVANCFDCVGVPFSMKVMTAAAHSQWKDL